MSVEVGVVRLADRRLACALAPSLAPLLGDLDSVEVEVVVQDDGSREEIAAVAAVIRSGRAWTEARGRLRERRGWARRFARSTAEVVVLTPRG